jgi:hypothetical protein
VNVANRFSDLNIHNATQVAGELHPSFRRKPFKDRAQAINTLHGCLLENDTNGKVFDTN